MAFWMKKPKQHFVDGQRAGEMMCPDTLTLSEKTSLVALKVSSKGNLRTYSIVGL